MGFVASIFNSLGNAFILSPRINPVNHLDSVLAYVVGDTMGVFVFLLLLVIFRRLVLRRLSENVAGE